MALFKNKYFLTIFASIIIFSFFKLIYNAYRMQHDFALYEDIEYLYAEHEPIKIFPKAETAPSLENDSKVYEFLSQDDWQLEAPIAPAKPKPAPAKKAVKETASTTNPKAGETVDYQKYKIKITSNKPKTTTKSSSKNMVQLGAYRSLEKAEFEWHRISGNLPKLMKNKEFLVEKAYLNDKGAIYRLKVGPFSNSQSAKNFCNSLRKKQLDCFLTVN